MTFTIFLTAVVIALIFIKMRDIAKRNNLKPNAEKRLVTAGILLILFLVTNVTLPYPQSLYWFIFSSITVIGIVLCKDIARKEYTRFKNLSRKKMIMNVVFYSLFVVVTHLYI